MGVWGEGGGGEAYGGVWVPLVVRIHGHLLDRQLIDGEWMSPTES